VLATRALVETPSSIIPPETTDRSRNLRDAKNCLRSWRQSADTVTSARRSKVIGGRIYDTAMWLDRSRVAQVSKPALKIACRFQSRPRAQLSREIYFGNDDG
jgi:hypothetical protein